MEITVLQYSKHKLQIQVSVRVSRAAISASPESLLEKQSL